MKHITKGQRYQIEAYLKCGKSKEFIAGSLGVDKSTIHREVKRNSSKQGKYNGEYAQMLSKERKDRFTKPRKFDHNVERFVSKHITEEQWSPEQIVGFCSRNGIKMVSHERIYQYVREDKSNGGGLYKHLRHRLKHRKRPVGGKHIPIKNRVSIDERPELVNDKERFGDWEIDTIVGKENRGAIVTIVERQTGFLLMKKLDKGKEAKPLADTVIKMMLPYKGRVHSITADNGTEFAAHERIAEKLKTKVFFAHPYSSWERGLNEYTNKLIRQYIPKKTEFGNVNDKQITKIQKKINRRPRKLLDFEKPTKLFYNLVS